MNFSAGCIRGVTRTRTGVRKQVVADICSARGPWCPCHPLTLTLSLLSFYPIPPSSPTSSVLPPGARLLDCQQMQKRGRETENESETVFFSLYLSFSFFFFCGLTFSAGGPSTPKVERGWTQLQRRTCPRHK